MRCVKAYSLQVSFLPLIRSLILFHGVDRNENVDESNESANALGVGLLIYTCIPICILFCLRPRDFSLVHI